MAKESVSVFDQFTGKYQLSKTLRFELRPIWNTRQMLDDERNPVIEHDQVRHEKYEAVKFWLDRLHRDFIEDALKNFKFKDLKTYQSALEAWQKDRKSKQAQGTLAKAEASLREEVVNCFEEAANIWATSEPYKSLGLKKEGKDMLFEAGVFKLLKERFKDEQDTTIKGKNIFDDWNSWTGYFKKFFETRKNFYKSDDTSTAIAYRIVNQNLRRFCENVKVFEDIRKIVDVVEVEKNFNVSCPDIFSLSYYNSFLLQDGIDAYNKIIGGEVRGKDEKIQGINELINKYRQDHPGDKVSFLKMLDKQIHSEKEPFIESVETDVELVRRLKDFHKNADTKIQAFRKLIVDIAHDYSAYDLNKIYLSKEALARNASRWFANYGSFERDLFAIVAEKQNKQEYEALRTHKDDSKISDKDGKFSFPDFIRCSHIKQALEKQEGRIWREKSYEDITSLDKIVDLFAQFLHVFQSELGRQFFYKTTDAATGKQVDLGYDVFVKEIVDLIGQDAPAINQEEKVAIKNFADTTLSIYRMAKYFAVEKRRGWLESYDLDDRFYKTSGIGYENFYRDAFEQIIRPYNLFRNYLTKKPYNLDKWPLYFENPTLADGWDKNKEQENATVLFERSGEFVLGIMRKNHTDLFDDHKTEVGVSSKAGMYHKMVYKYFPNPSRMIPKCSTQTKEIKNHFKNSSKSCCLSDEKKFISPFTISRVIYELNNFEYPKSYLQTVNGGVLDELQRVKADSKKSNQIKVFQKEFLKLSGCKQLYREALTDWINFCKSFLEAYRSTATSGFDYSHLKDSKEYESVDQFYRDVEKGSYGISWINISEEYLQKKNTAGELFLFGIHNKDWNLKAGQKKAGTKNLHTLYFEQLFSAENAKENFLLKLNGEAELFFRPATKIDKLGYREKDGKVLTNKHGEKVIKNYRYSKDKIFFHCPITLNRVSENSTKSEIDAQMRETLAEQPEMNIIGMDRGEKNLVYYSVIDQKGDIKETNTLNAIGKDGNGNAVQYAEKLEKRAQEREASRRDWKDVEAIKDLKRGYISEVAHKLADLIIQYQAFIVLEDLSMGFKQTRGGVESSVYQQLEKALIDKLNYLVFKNKKTPEQAGHILRAYQLTAPFTAFKDMGKQTGLIFYTQAGYTSKTCPRCGFHRNAKFQFENVEQAKTLLKNLEAIIYDRVSDAFSVTYSLKKFFKKEQKKIKKRQNELYSNVLPKDIFQLSTKNAVRYKWHDRYSSKATTSKRGMRDLPDETKKGVIKEFTLTEYMKGLFEDEKISYKQESISQLINSKTLATQFYKDFLYALFLLTETRHTISGTGTDNIQCPECEFDSQQGFQSIKDFNGDANGAYNIARKGAMILEKIKQFKENNEGVEKMGWGDLAISIEEWDKFTQIVSRENKR